MQVTNDTASPCNGMADADMQAALQTWVQTTAGSVRQDTAYWDKIRAVRLGLLDRTCRRACEGCGCAGGLFTLDQHE